MNKLVLDADTFELLTYRYCSKVNDSLIVPAVICRMICEYLMSFRLTVSSIINFPTNWVHFDIDKKVLYKGLNKLKATWRSFHCQHKDGYVYPDECGKLIPPTINHNEFKMRYGNEGNKFKYFNFASHPIGEFRCYAGSCIESWEPNGKIDLLNFRFILYHKHADPKTPYVGFGIEMEKHRPKDYIAHRSSDVSDKSWIGLAAPLILMVQWGGITTTKFNTYYHETGEEVDEEHTLYDSLQKFEFELETSTYCNFHISIKVSNNYMHLYR